MLLVLWKFPPPPLATNQTKIPYPKPLKVKHSNKSELRLNESKNNSLKIYFLVIKTNFSLLKIIYVLCIKVFIKPPILFLCTRNFSTPPPHLKKTLYGGGWKNWGDFNPLLLKSCVRPCINYFTSLLRTYPLFRF